MAQLANYNFDIIYKSGKKNIDADRLSRVKWPDTAQEVLCQSFTCQAVSALLGGAQITNAIVEAIDLLVSPGGTRHRGYTTADSNQPASTMDFWTLEPSRGGVENVLVVTDHFTQYAQAYPTSNQTAKTTAKTLFDNFIVKLRFSCQDSQ